MSRTCWVLLCIAGLCAGACDETKEAVDGGGSRDPEEDAAQSEAEPAYALASVVIDPENNRTTYVQTVRSLEDGDFDNDEAIELPGNGVVLAHGRDLFVGHAEEPTWVRYSLSGDGAIEETGRLSLLDTGATYVDYGNAIVDDETAAARAEAARYSPRTAMPT